MERQNITKDGQFFKLHKTLDLCKKIFYIGYVEQMRLMAQKFLYLVDYWVLFPTSEYSGLLAVVGENDNEVHDILLNWREDYLGKYDNLIMQKVVDARTYALAEDVKSEVVESFTT